MSNHSTNDNETLLYACITEFSTLNISSYKFMSDGIGMGYFGVEYSIEDSKIKYIFERGYAEIYIDELRVKDVMVDFDPISIANNILLVEKIIGV